MQAEARQHYEDVKGMKLNVWKRPKEPRHPFRPMRNDHEACGSSPVPWLKSKIERPVTAETEEKMTRRELEDKIASLETIIKIERWPSKEREVRMESDSSAETARESKEKKQRIQGKSADEGPAGVNMVYTLPQSFKAEYVEYNEEMIDEEIGLTVAQLQLEDVKPADAVVFEKPSVIQTRFVRPLFIRALIEGRPVGRVMIDGGAMVNVMPTSFFRNLNLGSKSNGVEDLSSNKPLSKLQVLSNGGKSLQDAKVAKMRHKSFKKPTKMEGKGWRAPLP
uniref:Uncharacterized protein n=1 Tax=Ananas comosus var. bracteatus TaxID=296719 RepID=A0A6V7PED3_ANACO|nr:unnamed protein product [Ananas comosus var. bracteatus]